MSAYCEIADVYNWIPRGSVQNSARLLGSVATATDVITLDGHGLETDDPITFRADAGGELPTGLVEATTYYAIKLTDTTLSVAAAAAGSAIDLTSEGSNTLLIAPVPWVAWIAAASARMESTLPAHAVPLEAPFPEIVIVYTAGLVAVKALLWSGNAGPPGFTEEMERVRAELKEWRKNGIPIRGAIVPTSANRAISGGAAASDVRGWAGRGDTVLP